MLQEALSLATEFIDAALDNGPEYFSMVRVEDHMIIDVVIVVE